MEVTINIRMAFGDMIYLCLDLYESGTRLLERGAGDIKKGESPVVDHVQSR